ncbi:MAG: hypothetical protein PWQ31_430 [Eubacteriales bacterium]|nr:hypothetical protein [Eubacteriales bacterium]
MKKAKPSAKTAEGCFFLRKQNFFADNCVIENRRCQDTAADGKEDFPYGSSQ